MGCPVVDRSPATSTLSPTFSSVLPASVRLYSSVCSESPIFPREIRFAPKVGAYRILDPASAYSRCSLPITSGCSYTHCSVHTPAGIPILRRQEPVPPSRSTGPSSVSKRNSSLVICLSPFTDFVLLTSQYSTPAPEKQSFTQGHFICFLRCGAGRDGSAPPEQ